MSDGLPTRGIPGAMGLPWQTSSHGPYREARCPQTHTHPKHGWTGNLPMLAKSKQYWFYPTFNCRGLNPVKRARKLARKIEECHVAQDKLRWVIGTPQMTDSPLNLAIQEQIQKYREELRDLDA